MPLGQQRTEQVEAMSRACLEAPRIGGSTAPLVVVGLRNLPLCVLFHTGLSQSPPTRANLLMTHPRPVTRTSLPPTNVRRVCS